MNKTEHTPTPWYKDGRAIVTEPRIPEIEICVCTADSEVNEQESQANAAFIVRACNSHALLVEALKEAWALIDGMRKPGINLYVEESLVNKCQQALQKAGAI